MSINIYKDMQIRNGEYILENGEKQAVKFTGSTKCFYLENAAVTGL